MPTADTFGGQTLGSLLDAGATRLRAAGAREPRRQAATLWAALTGVSAGDVWLARERVLDDGLARRLEAAIERLAGGEPLEYVAGTAGFRTLELEVDARVLIPRPETEGLAELVLAWGRASFPSGSWGTAVDVCTGSGCLALSLAAEGGFAGVVGIDVSAEALAVAVRNRARVQPPVPVHLVRGDLLEPLAARRVTAVVANPPYVAIEEMTDLPPEVRRWEPHEALGSPEGGMGHTRRLLAAARECLVTGGLLALEIDSRRADRTLATAATCGWRNAALHRDLYGRARYLLATKE